MQWLLTPPNASVPQGKITSTIFCKSFSKYRKLSDAVSKMMAAANSSVQSIAQLCDSIALKWRYHLLSCDYVPIRYIFYTSNCYVQSRFANTHFFFRREASGPIFHTVLRPRWHHISLDQYLSIPMSVSSRPPKAIPITSIPYFCRYLDIKYLLSCSGDSFLHAFMPPPPHVLGNASVHV